VAVSGAGSIGLERFTLSDDGLRGGIVESQQLSSLGLVKTRMKNGDLKMGYLLD
jgi:hypothetical protein